MKKFLSFITNKIFLIVLAAVLVVGGGTTAAIVVMNNSSTDEEAVDPNGLFWNIDRSEFMNKSTTGYTTRKVDEDDNLYHVMLATDDGRHVNRKIKDKDVVKDVDWERIFGITVDSDGAINGVKTLEDLKLKVTADMFYVTEINGTTAIANSSSSFRGVEQKVTWTSKTKLIDVSGYSGDEGTLVKALQPDDRIVCVENEKGELTHIYIVDRQDYTETYMAYCEHCKEEVLWKGWASKNSLPVRSSTRYKHYYLCNDVELSGQMNVRADQKLCLDLKGHTVNGKTDKRMYSLHEKNAELAIMDTSEGKAGKFIAHGAGATEGVCVWVRYGTFSLYAGTLDSSDFTNQLNGSTVNVPYNSTFNMYGGAIVGGTTKSNKYLDTKNNVVKMHGGLGGNVFVGGVLNLSGGEIKDGQAIALEYEKDDGSIGRNGGYGGNIYINSVGQVNISGGTISNGTATISAGNISTEYSSKNNRAGTINMSGGTITGGKNLLEGKNGGSIYFCQEFTFNMSGGVIEKGLATNCGGNFSAVRAHVKMTGGTIKDGSCINQKGDGPKSGNTFFNRGTFEMTGGTIVGQCDIANVTDITDFKISGNAKITGGTKFNLSVPTGKLITVGKLSSGAKIGVNASGYFANSGMSSNKEYFTDDYKTSTVGFNANKLYIGEIHCVCGGLKPIGHVCKDEMFGPWRNNTSLPNGTGFYYLTEDVNTGGQTSIKSNKNVVLDLKGHTVTSKENKRAYAVFEKGASLTILDTSGNNSGRIISHGNTADEGTCVWVRYGKFTMFGGTLDASGYTQLNRGTTVCVNTDYAFDLYGGVLIGGTCQGNRYTKSDGNSATRGGLGGTVYCDGAFNMYGGEIRDGKAISLEETKADGTVSRVGGYGGNLYLGPKSSVNMYSGTITNGTASLSGGNISTEYSQSRDLAGTFNMFDGLINGGQNLVAGKNGGSIYLCKNYAFTLSGGVIQNGVSQNCAGNIYVGNSVLNINGGTVKGGSCVSKSGDGVRSGNIFANGGTVNMTGGTVEGNFDIATVDNYAKLNLSGNIQINGAQTNLYIPSGKAINVGKLSSSANIGVTAGGYFTTEVSENVKDNFAADIDADIFYVNNKLFLGDMHCICGGTKPTGHVCENVPFIPWNNSTTLPTTTGNYYLTRDVNVSGQQNISSNVQITLCLNGYTVKTKEGVTNGRVYMINNADAIVNITDCKGTGKILLSDDTANEGAIVHIENGTLNIYNGTFDGNGHKSTHEKRGGGLIRVATNGTLNIYGGTLTGGSASRGGNIHSAGKLNMFGGTVTKGMASVNGGNIYLDGTSSVANISGGNITEGNAVNCGGNIAVFAGGTLNLTGGNVSDGIAQSTAGDGKRSQNIFIVKSKANFKDCTVAGFVDLNDECDVTLSGKVNISGKEYNLYVPAVKPVKIKELDESAVIGITSNGKFAVDDTETDKDNFQSFVNNFTLDSPSGRKLVCLVAKDKKSADYYVAVDGACAHCICGGAIQDGKEYKDGTKHICEATIWTAWNDDKTLPTTSGYYYLTKDVTVSKQQNVNTEATVNLCLNGFTVKAKEDVENCRVYMINNAKAVVNITDCKNTGTVLLTSDTTNEGAIIHIESGTLNLYGGTYDGNGYKTTHSSRGGGIIRVAANGKLNMYGGTLQNGSAILGGALHINGEVNLYKGTITSSTATKQGGNIYSLGKLNIFDDFIIDKGVSSGSNGGNIFMTYSTSVCTVYGGTVKDGKTANCGGNICAFVDASKGAPTLNIKGGTVTGGITTKTDNNISNRSVNIFVNASVFNMSSGTVNGYIYLNDTCDVTLSGNAKICGGNTNLFIPKTKKVKFGTLSEGASIYISSSTTAAEEVISDACPTNFDKYLFCDNSAYKVAKSDDALILKKK